jgi:hypothetical protein
VFLGRIVPGAGSKILHLDQCLLRFEEIAHEFLEIQPVELSPTLGLESEVEVEPVDVGDDPFLDGP